MTKTPMPAHEIPVYRMQTIDEWDHLVKKIPFGLGVMAYHAETVVNKTDDNLRAEIVCFSRPDYPQSDIADKTEVIIVLPPGYTDGGIRMNQEVDKGCVALETRKIQHLRTTSQATTAEPKGTP